VSVGKTDRIEFKSLLQTFDPTYSVEFLDETKHVKWFYRNSTKQKKSFIEMIFLLIFIKKVFVVVVDVSNHSVHVFEHFRKG
jgi:hypothetical protein